MVAELPTGGCANAAYESLNRGDSVTALSPYSSVNATYTGKPIAYGGWLGGIANTGVLYYGSSSSVKFRASATDALVSTASAFPSGTVQDIVLDTNDWRRVFVAGSSLVYYSTNSGTNWINITGNLTGVGSLHTLEFFRLYGADCLAVGADVGVYCCYVTGLGSWFKLGSGLPNAIVYDMTFSAKDGVLVVGTMGRGAFALATTTPGPVLANIESTTLSYLENQPATNITSTLTLTNGTSTNLVSATVSITAGLAGGQDILSLNASPPAGITTNYNAGTGVLSLTGSNSLANYQSALRSVTYLNTSENPLASTRTVAFKVNDGTADSNIQTRNVTVTPVNDAPTLTTISTLPGATEDTPFTITFATLGAASNTNDVDGNALQFRIVAVSSGTLTKGGSAVVPGTTLLGPGESLAWTPATNANGTLNAFTVKAWDGALASTTPVQVQVQVTAVNDAPSFVKGPNQSVMACAGAQSVSGWATNLSPGPTDESAQTLDFLVTNSHNGLFSAQPEVSPAGTLTYTLAANSNGVAVVSVRLHDSGGTANGGTNISPEQTFTITVSDTQPPTIVCPTNVVVAADPGTCQSTNVILDSPQTSDNCAVATVTNDAPTIFPKGLTLVTWTVTDTSGNANTCVQIVMVNDTEPPTIVRPTNVIVAADPGTCQTTNVVLLPPQTADNCAVASLTNDAPAMFPKGLTVVTWTVIDTSGNTNSCFQTVTVHDTEAPTITCPPNLVIRTNTSPYPPTNLVLELPQTSDNCGVASVTNDAPAVFPDGLTLVTWTATDTSGNTNSCIQIVTVNDTEPPTLLCPSNIVVSADPGTCQSTSVILGSPQTSDNCAVATVTNDAPTIFPKGLTLVIWTVTDTSGNTNACVQLVAVNDTEPPTIACPTNIVANADPGQCSKTNVTWEVEASDNCAVTNLACVPLSGSTFPVGLTTVTCTATDASPS